MTRLLDGPAAGVTLWLSRAPVFLRVVQAPDGTWDALDQLTDTPRPDERLVVYQLASEPRRMHVQRREICRRVCSWYEGGDYRLAADPPAEAVARDRTRWEAWATTEGPRRYPDAGVVDPRADE